MEFSSLISISPSLKSVSYTHLLEKLEQDIKDRTDDVTDFRQMGIDHLFVDESHNFKNLMFNTRHARVSGLGNPEGSMKAIGTHRHDPHPPAVRFVLITGSRVHMGGREMPRSPLIFNQFPT